MLTYPTTATESSVWQLLKENELFRLQKYNIEATKTVWATLQNVFESRQPPFRIVLAQENNVLKMVAAAETLKDISLDWSWIENNLMNELLVLDDQKEKEEFCLCKFLSMVQGTETEDEKSLDAKFRDASRAWRSVFKPHASEKFVNYYSCAYDGKLQNQGWLYVSMSTLSFNSLILGVELKVVVALKDIEGIEKDRSKRVLLGDCFRVTTKNKHIHLFSNLFHRDETFELVEYLTSLAMVKLLKTTNTDSAPGLSYATKQNENNTVMLTSPAAILGLVNAGAGKTLQEMFEIQRNNTKFQSLFSLSHSETILQEVPATLTIPGKDFLFNGTLYISETFLCFNSSRQNQCKLSIPFYSILKVERVNTQQTSTLALSLRHKLKIQFLFVCETKKSQEFCRLMKIQLQTHVNSMRKLPAFLKTCPSEDLVGGRDMAIGGLGIQFGYIESKRSAEKSKLRYWVTYYQEYGLNLSVIKLPTFHKLVRIGLPNQIRGELWEVCSGSIYKRFENEGYYEALHTLHQGESSLSTEEIEKDLNRSLPEYAGFQNEIGINALRRVLNAYSYHEPEIGYCQAMNIIASLFLIYLSEEQSFWLLTIITSQKLPGYYTVSMVGAIIDNEVFEILLQQTMPILGAHLKQQDIQLSVACLPWFLTLYMNSLPIPFALRIMDCFFLEGVKVLFQVGLAIFKINGDAIMGIRDDGELMNILKGYFLTLGETETEMSSGSTRPAVSFNTLIMTAYREFQDITNELVFTLRKSSSFPVIQKMDLYTKRSLVRSLKNLGGFSRDQLLTVCDMFYTCKREVSGDRIDYSGFASTMGKLAAWADIENPADDSPELGSSFLLNLFETIFLKPNYSRSNAVSEKTINLQEFVLGLSRMVNSGVISTLECLFECHDLDNDLKLSRQELISVSETFLFMHRNIESDKKLGSISSFINRAFMMNIKSEQIQSDCVSISFDDFKELISADDFLLTYFNGFLSTFVLTSNDAGGVEKTVLTANSSPNGKERDSIFTGGLKWARTAAMKPLRPANTEKVSSSIFAEPELGEEKDNEQLAMIEEVEKLLRDADFIVSENSSE